MKFKIISYYTKNTGYEKEVLYLIASLEKLKNEGYHIEYFVYGVDNLGNWAINTRYKAKFIKEKLEEFKCPLVFIDADAEVKQYPKLFDTLDCDIAVHYRESHKTILSGTIYIDYNEKTIKLLDEWIRLNKINSVLEQKNLEKAINICKQYGLNWVDLDPTYVQIFDTMKDVGEPVILHNQASRKYRRTLNG